MRRRSLSTLKSSLPLDSFEYVFTVSVIIQNTLNDIRDRYYTTLESHGVHLAFKQIFCCLDSFVNAIHKEHETMGNVKTANEHPNILVILTSGISFRDVNDSVQRYIPRSDVFPCDDRPLPIPSFVESDLSDSYVRPASPGILDWEGEDDNPFGLQLDEDEGPSRRRRFNPLHSRSNSPSIGRPVRFPNIAHFAQFAISLPNHYTAAGGECPGRATLLTGQLPPVHGVRTSLEKTGARGELRRDEVPTLGHYLSQAGYDVVYKGEWGLSEVQAFQEHPLLDLLGVERDAGEDLQPFGFQGWEAHCEGDWYQRSLQTTSEAVEYMRRRQSVMSAQSLRGSQPPPWALVVSYPDIMPNLAEAGVCRDIVECDGETGRVRARSEDREDGFHGAGETRPTVQRRFVEHCQNVGEAAISEEFEENAKRLDQLLGELLQEVLRSDGGDTVIVVTASNGNCEGDHGLWGCCYNAYDRSIHVPCLLYLPSQFYAQQRALQQQALSAMTSSIDLLPTLLHLTGVDREELQRRLAATHKKVPDLVGCDLCIAGDGAQRSVYYQNEDVAMPLPRAASLSMLSSVFEEAPPRNESLVLRRSVAAVVSQLRGRKMKLCYYSSDPRSCVHLDVGSDVNHDTGRDVECEWECFDLKADAEEVGEEGESEL